MSPAPEVVILADDLSGAADSAITCVNAGLEAEVFLGHSAASCTQRVVAVDADTRALPVQEAAQRMHALAATWTREYRPSLFKKIDSTLRGHLGPEILAVLRAMRAVTPDAVAVVAPALPTHGRVTIDGLHRVHGRPLHLTDMWRHEGNGGEAHIPRLLEQAGLRCLHLSLQQVRYQNIALATEVRGTMQGIDAIVCDAVDDEDLAAVASLAVSLGKRALWVGSAGLASHLPRAAGLVPRHSARASLPTPSGPVLFVLGSAAQRTREQAAVLLSQSKVRSFVLKAEVLLGGPAGHEWKVCCDELYSTLARGKDVLLMPAAEPVLEPQHRSALSSALAQMTADLRDHVGTLIASGGETARKVLDRWSVQVLRLHGELESGVPVSQAELPAERALTVITKAGDFGRPETLLDSWRWIQRSRRDEE